MFDAIIAALTARFGEGHIGLDEDRELRSISIPNTGLMVSFAQHQAAWSVLQDGKELTPRRDFNEGASGTAIVAAVEEVLVRIEAEKAKADSAV